MKNFTTSRRDIGALATNQRPPVPMLTMVTMIYVYAVLIIVPFIYDQYYFNILETKYYTYCALSGLYIVGAMTILCARGFKSGFHINLSTLKQKLSIPDIMLLSFLLIMTISTCLSDYSYEAFWGNEGRYTGLFLWTLYVFTYFLITRFGRLKKEFLIAFLLMGTFVCLFGITDYFSMDLLNFKAEGLREQDFRIYVSTIGNINTYTTYVALVMAIASILFTKEKSRSWSILYLVIATISFWAIIMGESDNSYLSLAVLFGLSPLYLFRTKSGTKRYLILLISFLTSTRIIDWINDIAANRVLGIDSLFNQIAEFKYLLIIIAVLATIVVSWHLIESATKTEDGFNDNLGNKLVFPWLVIVVLIFSVICFVLYDVNVNENIERYGSLSYYLNFNDNWGTNRGYIWRKLLEIYGDFPLKQKVFGFGPETFVILMYTYARQEMVEIYKQIFDSAHNEYLQYLITIGAAGLLAYLGFMISSFIRLVKMGKDEPCVIAIFFAVLCYCAQAIVNINVPIVAPVMMTLLMIGLTYCQQKKES